MRVVSAVGTTCSPSGGRVKGSESPSRGWSAIVTVPFASFAFFARFVVQIPSQRIEKTTNRSAANA